MGNKSNEGLEAKIARLEEEKSLLWAIIADLEDWMFGEGCFVSERTKAKLEIARTLMAPVENDVQRYRDRLFTCYQKAQITKPDRRRIERTPEEREKQAARMRAYWAERKQRSIA